MSIWLLNFGVGIFIEILNYTSIFVTCVYFLKFQLIPTMMLHARVLDGPPYTFLTKTPAFDQ